MTIIQTLLLAAAAALIGLLPRGRTLTLAGVSMFVLFWLSQPVETLVSLPFWLQVLAAFLTVAVWWITAPAELRQLRKQWPALAVLAGAIFLTVFIARLPIDPILSIPIASPLTVGGVLLIFVIFLFLLNQAARFNRIWAALGVLTLLFFFMVVKSPAISSQIEIGLSILRGGAAPASPSLAIAWLGYSYLAFRLLHVLRDWQSGLLPPIHLDEFICYALFFPSCVSGPIDRVERFTKDLRASKRLDHETLLAGGQRLAVGLFKKFVLADWLAWLSISDALVEQTRGGAWLWLFLYAYAFRLYFDFSGYTDIAIGLGRLTGVSLPENFASPYLQPNLTQFWNSWHITLTQWLRAYVFNPLTRFLRTAKRPLPLWLILLSAQLVTMSLIGLWHGFTWNFLLWGVWNGAGLFLQNRWSELVRGRFAHWNARPLARHALTAGGIFLTFNYFSLSLVFFSLSSPQASIAALMKLFGVS